MSRGAQLGLRTMFLAALWSTCLSSQVSRAAEPPWAGAHEGPVPAGGLATPLSSLETNALEEAARRLRHHVARIEAEMPPPPEGHLSPELVDGWCIVTGARELRCQAFLVKGAARITVEGPAGRARAEVRALDLELRVARLRPEVPVTELGLAPATPSDPGTRETDMDVFALVSTRPGAGVVTGALTNLGDLPHLEGNLRSTLELARGMPVFDARLRWLGLARAVAWDKDRAMLIPPELTRIRTSTAAAARSEPLPAEAPERPWWAR